MKPLSVTLTGQRARLAPLLTMIHSMADKEGVDSKTITALGLQFVTCSAGFNRTSSICRE